MFTVPHLNKRNVYGSPRATRTEVEWPRCPQQSYPIGCVVSVERCVLQKWLHIARKNKVIVIIRFWFFCLQGEEERIRRRKD